MIEIAEVGGLHHRYERRAAFGSGWKYRPDRVLAKDNTLRIPWLIPVQAGSLSFDLLVLYLKSGGDFPQADEVNAIQRFITQRQVAPSPRHLIVCGD